MRRLFLLLACLAGPAGAETRVDLALVLAADVSFSIHPAEGDLQRRGHVAAFRDPAMAHAVAQGPEGRIAVLYMEWAGEDLARTVVDWTFLERPEDLRRFADMLETAPVARSGRTALSSALIAAAARFDTLPVAAERRVIDISADGVNNDGPAVTRARDAVLARGITINGLPILAGPPPPVPLDRYFADCVVGGRGAFVLPVAGWDDFARALRIKLWTEIAAPPDRLWQARMATDCLAGERQERDAYLRQLRDLTQGKTDRWMPQDWPLPD